MGETLDDVLVRWQSENLIPYLLLRSPFLCLDGRDEGGVDQEPGVKFLIGFGHVGKFFSVAHEEFIESLEQKRRVSGRVIEKTEVIV